MMILRSHVLEVEKTRSKCTCSISFNGTTKKGKSVTLMRAYVVGWMNTICCQENTKKNIQGRPHNPFREEEEAAGKFEGTSRVVDTECRNQGLLSCAHLLGQRRYRENASAQESGGVGSGPTHSPP